MPAHIILVHDDPALLECSTRALRSAGLWDIAPFDNSMRALEAIEAPGNAEILVTRLRFPEGQPNGLSLAQLARARRRSMKLIFMSVPELKEHVKGLGPYLPFPLDCDALVRAVRAADDELRAAQVGRGD